MVWNLLAATTTTSLLTEVATVLTWFWDNTFASLLDTMTSNPLFFLPIATSFGIAFVFVAIRMVRKFGVKSKI